MVDVVSRTVHISDLEWILKQVGAVDSQLEEDPSHSRKSKTAIRLERHSRKDDSDDDE